MLLITHIIIALLGIASATILAVSPTKRKLQTAYAFAGGTLATGTILTLQYPSHLAESCIVGLAYFSAIGVLIAISHRKLAKQSIN
jgi:hypothetical protein